MASINVADLKYDAALDIYVYPKCFSNEVKLNANQKMETTFTIPHKAMEKMIRAYVKKTYGSVSKKTNYGIDSREDFGSFMGLFPNKDINSYRQTGDYVARFEKEETNGR